MDWEQIFAKYVCDKELLSEYKKNSQKFSKWKTNHPVNRQKI